MRIRRLSIFACALFAALGTVQVSARAATNWLTSEENRSYLGQIVTTGQEPVSARTGLVHGHVHPQAIFAPSRVGMDWIARHGMPEGAFARSDAQFRQQGHQLAFQLRFDTEGMKRNRGIRAP